MTNQDLLRSTPDSTILRSFGRARSPWKWNQTLRNPTFKRKQHDKMKKMEEQTAKET